MKQRIKELTENQKMTIQLWLGTVLCLFGVSMLIASFAVPPLGIVDSSILAAVGEVFTFSGALIGIDYTYKYKRFKIEDERVKGGYERNKNNTDTGNNTDDEPND